MSNRRLNVPLRFAGSSWIGIDSETGPDPWLVMARVVFGRVRTRSWRRSSAPAAVRRRIAAGDRCAAALPVRSGLVVRLQVPPLPEAKRRRVLPGLLDLQLPFPIDQCACAFVDSSEETLALVVRHEDLRQSLEQFAALDLNPERLIPFAWAVWRQASREVPAPDATQRRVVVVASAERRVVVSGIGTQFGSATVVAASSDDALRRALQMAFGAIPPAGVCVCAGPAAAEVARSLAQWPAPWNLVACPVAEPETFVARALAIDALLDASGQTHVRCAPYAHPRVGGANARALRFAIAVALVGATTLLTTSFVVRNAVRANEVEAAQTLADRLTAVAGYRVNTRGVRAVQEARESLRARLDPWVERLRAPTVSVALGSVLGAAKAQSVQITHLALDARGLTLSGRGPSSATANAFAAALRGTNLPVRLEVDPRPADGGETAFLMTPEALP